MENLSEAEWPEWTSKKQELLIDGLSVTQVFSNVHIQLETLRKRKFATKAGLLFEDELNNMADKLNKLANAGADRVPQIEMKMKVFERRLDSLDDSVADKSDLARLEIKLAGRIEGLEKRISTVESTLAGLSGLGASGLGVSAVSYGVGGGPGMGGSSVSFSGIPREDVAADSSLQGRLEFLENKVLGAAGGSLSLENSLQMMTSQFNDLKKQLEGLPKRVSELGDSCSVNECKIGGLENLFSDLHTGYNRVKIVMERLPEECYHKVKGELSVLDEKKADRSEIARKADINMLHLKADVSEVTMVNDLSHHLDKKLENNKTEFNESLKSLRSNYDKRLEALLQWILKQLRRLAGNVRRRPSDASGTDIGKVRCLVCDQTVGQLVATDTVFGGPALPSSLKALTQGGRPLPFENGMEPRQTPRQGSTTLTQPWGRGQNGQTLNRSPSPPNAPGTGSPSSKGSRLSPKNLESLGGVDRGLDRIFQGLAPGPTGPATQRPGSAYSGGSAKSDSDKALLFSQTDILQPLPVHSEGYTGPGDRKLSQFKELELRRGNLSRQPSSLQEPEEDRPQSAPSNKSKARKSSLQ